MSTSQRYLSASNAPLSVHEIQHSGMLPRPVTSLRQTTGSLKGTGSTPVARTEALWSEPTPFRPSSEFHQVSFSPPLRSFTLATVATDNDWSQPERDRSMTSPASSRRSSVTTHVTTDLDEGKIYSLVVIESTPTSTSHAKQASPPSPRSPLASTQSVTGQSSTMDLERMTDSTGILGTSHLEDGYESSHSYLSHRSPPSLSEAGASYRSAPSESAGSPSSQESAVSPLSADSKGHEDRLVPDGPGLRADAKDVPDDDPLELPDWLARSIPTLTILAQVAQASSLSNKGHHQHYHHHPRFPQHPSYGYGPRYKVEHRSTSWDQHQQQQSSSVRINVESTSFPFLKGPAHAPHHSVPPRDEFAYYRDPLPEAHVSRYAYRGSESDVKAELQTADDRRADDPRMPYPKPPPPPPPSYADATSQEMYRRRASAGGLNRRPSYGTLIHRDRSATSPYPSMSNSASAGSRQSKGEYSRARTQVHLHPNDTVRLKPFPDFDSGRPRDLSQAALKPGSRCVVSTSGDAKRLAFKPASQPQQPAGQIGLTTLEAAKAAPTADRPFACPGCDRTFARRYDRNRHARKHTGEKPYPCVNPDCAEEFGRPDALQRHYRSHPECETIRGMQGSAGGVTMSDKVILRGVPRHTNNNSSNSMELSVSPPGSPNTPGRARASRSPANTSSMDGSVDAEHDELLSDDEIILA